MIDNISLVLFGCMLTSIPLITYWLYGQSKNTIATCEKLQKELEEPIEKLRSLHTSALSRYSEMDLRIQKLETEVQAARYGKSQRGFSV